MTHSSNISAESIPVWNALNNALEQERFPQMLLLDGSDGIGKKLIAMDLAKILCEQSNEPLIWLIPLDGEAKDRDTLAKVDARIAELSQKFIKNPFHIGYITDSAMISVGMVENLMKNFELKASGNRVVIITNADLMNEPSANKLLKTFEEVPPNTYFILTATSRHLLLPTIRSRSTCFSVPSASKGEVSRILAAYGYSVSADDIWEFAAGSVGKAMLALDSNYLELKEKIAIYANHALNGDASAAILYAGEIDKSVNTVAFFLEGLALYLIKKNNPKYLVHIHSINFLLRAVLAKKFTTEHAIQNMALRMAQKEI